MIRIALDLELEQPKSNTQTTDSLLDEQKIIQVGYVIFEDSPFEVLLERCLHVNIGVPLSQYIKTLTHITDEDLANGTDLQSIYQVLRSDREKFDASRIMVLWGSGDQEALKKELHNPEDWPFGRSGRNAKHLYQDYASMNGQNMSGGLSKCLNKLGLKWMGGRKHNALADAINTAQIYSWMLQKLKSQS